MLDRLPPELQKLFLYALCGGSGVLLDLIVYAVLVEVGYWYQAANLAGYASGTLLSFLLNRTITFQVSDAPMRRLVLFFLVAGVGYSLSSVVLWLLVEQFSINALQAKIAALAVVLVTQYSLNSRITFRAKAPEKAQR